MKIINYKRLTSNIEQLKSEFNRRPYNYIIIDNFLHANVANEIFNEFPSIKTDWVDARGLHTQNKWTQPVVDSGIASDFFKEANSEEFLSFLSNLTGIPNLLRDPELNGAGYHQTTNGGFLNVHVDFNRINNNENMDRRLNMLVYFNKNWEDQNGGFLELWDMKKKTRIENIGPYFNRCVIFETNEISFHGHPVPVKLSNNDSRKSLSIYYYTKGRDDLSYIPTHNTLYVNTESLSGIGKILKNGAKHAIRKLKKL
jgi:hypothetical protein